MTSIFIYFAPFLGRGVKYCDEYMSVCLSVRSHISETTRNLLCMSRLLPVVVWLGPPLTALRYMLCTSGFVEDALRR